MIIDLEKAYSIMNRLCDRHSELEEDGIYANLLGNKSNYYKITFENFLDFYSFSISGNTLIVFNDDRVPFEDYTNNDFSELPLSLLNDEVCIEEWLEKKIEKHIEDKRIKKESDKERILLEISRLHKQLDNL